MPVLIPGGPHLPVELMEAQAGGDLVVFAGAGVSVPAGLPTFGDLVKRVYGELAESFMGAEKVLFERGEHDRVLGLLEDRVGGHMRRKVQEILKPAEAANIEVHRALLDISRAGAELRLVTTNFDRLFLEAGVERPQVKVAPGLPIPRKTRWHGLVHLHGLIEEVDREGKNLVLTSADFGGAYLLDRWASRFVSELFQNFHVLFVGYGVNDPVMRYLLDALAGERNRGEQQFKKAFVLAGVKGSAAKREQLKEEWRAKGVEPIFYDAGWEHRALVKTLKRWAQLCRGGLRTRQAWALRQAEHPPANPNEDEARFVVWALSEPSGAVARAWADKEPAPHIGWLEIFEKSEELPDGAKLLALAPDPEIGQSGRVIPSRLPSVDSGWLTTHPRGLSKVTWQLSRWLARHLDKRELLAWALRQGGALHPDFRVQVRGRLGKTGAGALSSPFRRVWEVLSSEAYSARKRGDANAPDYETLLEHAQESPLARMEILCLLRPVPQLGEPRSRALESAFAKQSGIPDPRADPTTPRDLVDVGLEFAGGSSGDLLLQQLGSRATDSSLLTLLAEDIVGLLEDALQWLAYLGQADSDADGSHVFMPSIAPLAQNHHFKKWTRLVDLNRRVFEVLDDSAPERARRLVERWMEIPFPIFRRLALHGATDGKSVEADLGARLLLARERRMLWSDADGRRECLRFLRLAGARLSAEIGKDLLGAILEGPPRDERFEEIWDKAIWRRLVKLEMSGMALSPEATAFLSSVRQEKDWSIPEDQRDKFPFWPGDITSVEPPEGRDWRPLAKKRPATILGKLTRDAKARKWDAEIWAPAIQEFGTPDYDRVFDRRRFAVVATLLRQAPASFLERMIHTLASWLDAQSRQLPAECEEQFLDTWERLAPIALHEHCRVGRPTSEPRSQPSGGPTHGGGSATPLVQRPQAGGWVARRSRWTSAAVGACRRTGRLPGAGDARFDVALSLPSRQEVDRGGPLGPL